MCGIAGIVDFSEAIDQGTVRRMCDALEHRGPDSSGFHAEPGVALGVRRLAIIDIEGGDQPFFNEDGSVAVVLNGEIYNHDELRSELIDRGHRFSSRCDTEVLVHLYEELGDQMTERLRGMFAFAIWDRRRRRLFVARDRVGKKPLFWARRGARVWFASEMRALLQDPALPRSVNPDAIDAYLTLQYVPHPLSAIDGISKLPPASTLVVDEGSSRVETYWSLDYSDRLDGSARELADRAWEQVREATRLRLMSDVPLGAFLSGGLDSSAVVAAMAEQTSSPVKTFSIGFEDPEFDELDHARTVADHFATDHREFRVEPDASEIFPRIARQYGEPFADSSAIPSFYLAEIAGRDVTVALNGDGGDESFAGYARYLRGLRLARLGRGLGPLIRLAPQGGSTRMRQLAATLSLPAWERYSMSLVAFGRGARDELLSAEFEHSLGDRRGEGFLEAAWNTSAADAPLELMLDTDVRTYLPGALLPKIDIATMAHSVEARSPFLDHQLMEFAASIPPRLKIRGRETKHLLKAALRGRIPDAIIDRPKMPFSVPLARWFREELRDLPGEYLLDRRALDRGYFERATIERIIDAHRNGAADHSSRIWTLLQLELWHREVVDAPAGERQVVR